jgi:hypothetical protein
MGGTASSAAVSGTDVTYTLDGDFDKGTLVNVNHDAPKSNQIQLNETLSTFPFIWVALSQRCTIAKIDTVSGTILGEYRTIADSVGCNESSRTTVGLDGSVWVGHRGPGGVTHVGLKERNQCLDRNSNGTIETSAAYGEVKPWPGSISDIAKAEDECILHHVDTNALELSDSRHMSIDAGNNLWVGDFSSKKFVRIDGSTGVVAAAPKTMPCGGYGGLIDGQGVIWSASGGGVGLLRWDPNAADSATNPRCIQVPVYGVAVDPLGWVWTTVCCGGADGAVVRKVSPDGETVLGPFAHGAFAAQGLAIGADGDVWVSSALNCSVGCTVGHLNNDGTFVGSVPNPTGAGSTGVAIDAAGKIWTANRTSHTATRIDPTAGPAGADGSPTGAVDLTVNFPATEGRPLPYPYNYSDMTGAVALGSTSPQGSWNVVQDGGTAGKAWGTISWNTEAQGTVPAGSSILVEVRAADSEAGLGSQTFAAVSNNTAFSVTGRFLEVRVTMKPNEQNQSPVLSDLRVCAVGACVAAAPPPPPPPPAATTPRPPAATPRRPRAVRRCTVPNVKRKTVREARRAITRAGCRAVVMGRRYSATAAPGRVIGQSVPAGRRVRRGTVVRLLLSRGLQPVRPPFTG